MSDYLCPNCGPISDEGDMECLHDSESLYCALCGASEDEMTPLVSAYAQLQSELTAARDEAERLRGRVAELEEALRPFAEEAEYVPDYATDMHLNYEMDDAEILEYANFDAADIHKALKVLGQRASGLQAGGINDPT